MASSSASASYSSIDIPLREKYDVFLSFRGPNTRRSFTSHLKKALDDKKMDTFMDYNLERGEEIAPALLKAIERSVISVVVFSENYASSRWCLDELVHILECKKKYCGRHVIPIFYETVVSDIRHQSGSYELEERFKDRTETERLQWKVALIKAANLSGFESTSFRDDAQLVEEVVQLILTYLSYESTSYELNGFVGAGSRVEQIESLLCIVPQDDRVRSVVIWGMGGIGKTTLANAVFLRLSSQFDACCFLPDVREGSETQKDLKDLRNKLLHDLLGDKTLDIQSKTIDRTTAVKLSRKRVLVVLDDVDKSSQLEMLAGRDVTFGSGSRIIITTRDMQRVREMEVLKKGGNYDVEIYEVSKLNDDEARQLFKLNASAGIYSELDSTNLVTSLVAYAAGCPLALKIWSSLSNELSWDEMTKSVNEDMGSIYRVSYDVLRKNEKEIFLDIACFHKGKQINDVRGHLNCRRLSVDSGVADLIRRSLIELRDNCLWMHDVIQEMGREIVREKCPEEPGNRSRLYNLKDICHVLENDTGTATIETISIRSYVLNSLKLTPRVFGKMYNLTFLDLYGFGRFGKLELPEGRLKSLPNVLRYLSWPNFPLETLPSKFSPSCLVELHMPYSKLQTPWNKDQNPWNLKKIDLSYSAKLVDVPYLTACLESINLQGCESLVHVPNLSESLNIVSINLQECKKLVEVPSYFEKLHKLTVLNLKGCLLLKCIPEMPSNMEILLIGGQKSTIDYRTKDLMELSALPSSIWSLKKLVELDLNWCYHIKNLPSSIQMLQSLTSLDLSRTSIEGLPSSIECLSRIVSINLVGCTHLMSLSTRIWKLKSLEKLDLSGCSSFKFFPEFLEPMECLKTLRLSQTKIEKLHDSIENLVGLEELDLSQCWSLKSVSNNIYKLRFLKDFRVEYCYELKKLPMSSSDILWSLLSKLDLSGCTSLKRFPNGIMICLTSLKYLDFSDTKIKSIPTSIKELSGLTFLYICNCVKLKSLPKLPYLLEILDADSCRNLERVSFSMTGVTQGLDQICDENIVTRNELYSLRGCKKLSETAKRNLMNDAWLRIMRLATAFSKCKEIQPHFNPLPEDYSVSIVYPGHEIPEQFRCQTEGSSIDIKLPVHPSHTDTNLCQLVLGVVLTVNECDEDEHEYDVAHEYDWCKQCSFKQLIFIPDIIDVKCRFSFTTNNADSSELDFTLPSPGPLPGTRYYKNIKKMPSRFDTSQVFIWYFAHWSSYVRNASQALLNFYLEHKTLGRCFDRIKVKRCGVCLLSSQGEDVKLEEVNQDVGEPN